MWLFTRYGFYSIACAHGTDGSVNKKKLMIRARRFNHLKNLQTRFHFLSESEIVRLPNRDYRYRIVVAKEVWADVLSDLVQEQEWSNFKAEAGRYQASGGEDYIHALHDVWHVMKRFQDSEPRDGVS